MVPGKLAYACYAKIWTYSCLGKEGEGGGEREKERKKGECLRTYLSRDFQETCFLEELFVHFEGGCERIRAKFDSSSNPHLSSAHRCNRRLLQ